MPQFYGEEMHMTMNDLMTTPTIAVDDTVKPHDGFAMDALAQARQRWRQAQQQVKYAKERVHQCEGKSQATRQLCKWVQQNLAAISAGEPRAVERVGTYAEAQRTASDEAEAQTRQAW